MKNIIAALNLTAKGKFRFPNFTMGDFAARIIRAESRDGPFAQISYIAFLYTIRVPSGALQLRRAFSDDDLLGFPHNAKQRFNRYQG